MPTVRSALCDPLPEVRDTASTTFDHLHSTLGVQVLEKILPDLLERLSECDKFNEILFVKVNCITLLNLESTERLFISAMVV